MATITKSIWGESYSVEERIGDTLFYTSHESLEDAVAYCVNNGLGYVIE